MKRKEVAAKMKWLIVRLRARHINQITMSRLRAKFMQHCQPTDDNEQQADLCAQFEMRRRRVIVRDVKLIREADKIDHSVGKELREQLESTRVQRILGWEMGK